MLLEASCLAHPTVETLSHCPQHKPLAADNCLLPSSLCFPFILLPPKPSSMYKQQWGPKDIWVKQESCLFSQHFLSKYGSPCHGSLYYSELLKAVFWAYTSSFLSLECIIEIFCLFKKKFYGFPLLTQYLFHTACLSCTLNSAAWQFFCYFKGGAGGVNFIWR